MAGPDGAGLEALMRERAGLRDASFIETTAHLGGLAEVRQRGHDPTPVPHA
jgi:hypothetical protein